jgi:hypothetical protein
LKNLLDNVRVQIIEGKKPIIYVAPHGFENDDTNTAYIAEKLADYTNGYAVINRGWERANTVDYKNDKANCNNVEHCHKNVIKEEFLDPLIRFKNRIVKKWSRVCIVHLHGMADDIKNKTGLPDLNYVIGWGNGKPNSYSCQKWIKDFLIYNLATDDDCIVGEGKAGGNYAGWNKNNMNQLFSQWYPDDEVDSVQIEIAKSKRNSNMTSLLTAQTMALVMEGLLDNDSSWRMAVNYRIHKI